MSQTQTTSKPHFEPPGVTGKIPKVTKPGDVFNRHLPFDPVQHFQWEQALEARNLLYAPTTYYSPSGLGTASGLRDPHPNRRTFATPFSSANVLAAPYIRPKAKAIPPQNMMLGQGSKFHGRLEESEGLRKRIFDPDFTNERRYPIECLREELSLAKIDWEEGDSRSVLLRSYVAGLKEGFREALPEGEEMLDLSVQSYGDP